MRIYFAHQSVGADIVTGIEALARQGQPRPLLVDEKVGQNRAPLSKLAAFRQVLEAHPRPPYDVAFLKFCYVDICTLAEAQALFPHYVQAIEELSTARPELRLIHCTVPLRLLPNGAYAWLRRMLGHRHPAFAGNQAREWFNDQLRRRYGAHELFDLARLQSTHADGRRSEQRLRGQITPSLAPEWTYDGGHFNERGRTMAAAALVAFLDNLKKSLSKS